MPLSPLTVTADVLERFFAGDAAHLEQIVAGLARYVRDGFILFDVGANAGYFTKHFLNRFAHATGTVVLFEPVRNLSGISQQTLEFVRNADLLHVNSALGEEDGDLLVYLPTDDNLGWITAVEEYGKQGMQPMVVRVSSTRRYVERFRPNIIKIDVEGYESRVLRGILPLVDSSYRPALQIELNCNGALWPATLEVAEQFLRAGYEFRSLNHTPLSLDYIAKLNFTGDGLLVPRES